MGTVVTKKPPPIPRPHQPSSFSDVLGDMPALWTRLLAEHVPDVATGKRCQACTIAGTGSPGTAWPCRIRDAAEAAQARYPARRPGGGASC